MFLHLIILIFAYLAGSLNSAIILAKCLNLPDPRSQGSGNPGATNMLRIGGKKLALATLVLDCIKGIIPVLLARYLDFSPFSLSLVALFVISGHMFPIFFRFQGGKGVATSLGALLALSPALASLSLGTWLLVFAISRISALSAIIAIILTPFYAYFFLPKIVIAPIFLIALLILWRHKANIKRLLAGEEHKFGKK